MSTIGTHIRNSRFVRLVRDTRAGQEDSAAAPSPASTPYRLLWSTGIAAFVLCIIAFVLWGTSGTSALFDMIVALCT